MNENSLPVDEAFHNSFFHFVESLNVMTFDAAQQRESVGGSHVAWELQNDVCDFGDAVLRGAGSFLAQAERADISSLLGVIKRLPSDALRSEDAALNHPAWKAVRSEAAHVLARLARPIAENQAFFKK